MAINDLTLEEMFALEEAHPPLVGSRTSLFLEPVERAIARAGLDELRGRTEYKTRASANSGETASEAHSASETKTKPYTKAQIVSKVAAANSISKRQAVQILDTIAKLAKDHHKIALIKGLGRVSLTIQKSKPHRTAAPSRVSSAAREKKRAVR
jgi:hypothetical protein